MLALLAPVVVLRLATVIPDGTALARELRAFARQVDADTKSAVNVKWFFGAIAGDDLEMGARIARGQLDGAGAAGQLCEQAMPSTRALRVLGMIRWYDDAGWLRRQLQPILEAEAHQNGWNLLAASSLGPAVIFSRTPIRALSELRSHTFWRWSGDTVGGDMWRAMGLKTLQTPLDQANQAYEEGRVDGFVVIPQAALAFQMSTRAKYLTDFRSAFLTGCLLVADRAWDRLPHEYREVVKSAAAKAAARIDEVSQALDQQLLGGLFQKQGLQPVAPAPELEREFLAEAHRARDQLGDKVAPAATMRKILAAMADYLSERSAR